MTTETQPLPTDAATPPTHAADSVQDLQPVHDAVTIDLLNERVAYLERKLKEAGSVLEDANTLLQEVAACFTRDDDLPDNLLPRIDAVLKARKKGGA